MSIPDLRMKYPASLATYPVRTLAVKIGAVVVSGARRWCEIRRYQK